MRKNFRAIILVTAIALSLSAGKSQAARKVILDTDMAYLNDDALAMFVLCQADKAGMLELLGVTTAGGNVFVPEATTAALRQLELIGRQNIPVIISG
ncbi:MAG: nucleoside hydrolase [Synergistaceae bacterium]|nr:nucleoside hydrolase [Synergistaceae bacterium]